MMPLEPMDSFFAARVEGYDEHMITNVEGCKEGYIKMASLIPAGTQKLLDLGCGTGLELDEIFKQFPDLHVTGIDLTHAMLEKLLAKHPDKELTLICGDYFKTDFGTEIFDCAISFETMHHFPHEDKITLYRRIFDSLLPGGVYIECDYMVETQEEEDFLYAENERLRREQGIAPGEFYHFDTPCTIENQVSMFLAAGFESAIPVFRIGGTTIIVARKNS